MAEFETLLWEQDEHVATITLNRPEKKNAMSWRMFEEIRVAFERAGDDPDVRAVILTGAGGAFSSGADLTDPANAISNVFEMQDRMAKVQRIAAAFLECPKPTIAKVIGIAAGAGCNLALGCDLIVASTSAGFAELFVKRGLVVDFGGTWALTRVLPLHKAKELAFLGDTISAEEAAALGLLNRLCSPGEVDAVARDIARQLAARPPRTIRLLKNNLNRASERSLEENLDAESLAQTLCFASEDTREAVVAWVEKREPKFSGR
ncbi:MAG TPA: enoyl-CoA hydratase [Actinomycetota bacterium]|nr:enoyl-CoA hydratase [Actinomycetota bacterium]